MVFLSGNLELHCQEQNQFWNLWQLTVCLASLPLLSLLWSSPRAVAFVHLFGEINYTSVQLVCCVRLFATPWTAACQSSLYITNSRSLLKLLSIELVMPSNHLILCYPRLLPPSIFPSIRVFSTELVLHIRWPKHWSFSFSISPSNEYWRLISFRMDWLDLPAVQGTLKSLLQHRSSGASLWCSAFFNSLTLTSICD